MRILLSCIGLSDPFVDKELPPGPILTLLDELDFDKIYLLHGTDLNRSASDLREQIISRPRNRPEVEQRPMLLDDPSDYPVVLRAIREECIQICRKHPEPSTEFFAQISSGTPQMQWAWIILIHRGIVPAQAIALHPRYKKCYEPPYHYFLDLRDLGIDGLAKEGELEDSLRKVTEELRSLKLAYAKLPSQCGGPASAADDNELPEGFHLLDYLADEKRRFIAAALEKHPRNASEAARMVGMEPAAFRKAAARFGLRPRQRK